MSVELGGWRLTPLRPELAEVDFAAFFPCRQRLRHELGWNGWPPDDFTVTANVADLSDHYGEFERREAYAYSILDAEVCVGCVYIEPWKRGAQLHFWVVDTWLSRESDLLQSVLVWLETWPFEEVIVPLRPHATRMRKKVTALGLEMCQGPDGFVAYRRP
jgi:hypothetical protein